MSKTFHLYKTDYYYEHQKLYNKDILTLEENNIYCIVGCNGVGKSTALFQIKTLLNKDCFDLKDKLSFSLRGIFSDAKAPEEYNEYFLIGDLHTKLGFKEEDFLMQDIFNAQSSTGEQTINKLVPILGSLQKTLDLIKNKTVYLLVDDLDVGVSIDVLREVNAIFDRIITFLKKNNITYYIIITANSYELTKNKTCIDIINMAPIQFEDYEDYSNYIAATRKHKNKCLAYADKKIAEAKGKEDK